MRTPLLINARAVPTRQRPTSNQVSFLPGLTLPVPPPPAPPLQPLLSAASAGQGKTFVGLSALKSKTSEKSSHIMEAGCVVLLDGDVPSLVMDLYDAISLERPQFTSPGCELMV